MQIGYTRFWSLPATYGRHQMPRASPGVLHPFLQFPLVFTLETFRCLVPPFDEAADHVQRWRRNRWYLNETGNREADFKPVEEFRW